MPATHERERAVPPPPPVLPVEPAPARPLPFAPFLCALGIVGLTFVEPARGSARVTWSLYGVAAFLVIWGALALRRAKRDGRPLLAQFQSVRAHWVQALVQATIYAVWGYRSRGVYAEIPLIVSQVLYLYAFDALMSWTRGRTWRVGFGPLPVIFSTNLLLWFRHDWYFLQFVMVTIGALGKEFIRWRRDGRLTHVFNPSAFGQSTMAVLLIATGTTTFFTLGEEIAVSFESVPHILLVLFGLGLVVQALFGVTLMTMSAMCMLALLNVLYTQLTGGFYFVTINVGATIFLGLHLLMTDPSTSPKSLVARVIFGALYGLGYFLLFGLFNSIGVPVFWDKLLPVPVLNLSVKLLDRLTQAGFLGRLEQRWRHALSPRALNFTHMAVWAALFTVLYTSGFIGEGHKGKSLAFWVDAERRGVTGARENLILLAEARANAGSGEAANLLGELTLEGRVLQRDVARAADWFALACKNGSTAGCENVMRLFLLERRARSPEDVDMAITHLEASLAADPAAPIPAWLVGAAYETGSGRPQDAARAREVYEAADPGRDEAGSLAFWSEAAERRLPHAAENLARLADARARAGSGAAANLLGKLYLEGRVLRQDHAKAARWFVEACRRGETIGCENVAGHFVFGGFPYPPADAAAALDRLEAVVAADPAAASAAYLLGAAHATGKGRTKDLARARELLRLASAAGSSEAAAMLSTLRD